MKRWIVLLAVLPLAGGCFAEMDSNRVMRVRKMLREWGGGGCWPANSRQADLMGFLASENLKLEDILPEAERLAVQANDNQDPANRDAPRWGVTVCDQMLFLLGRTRDKRWLPLIERMALTAHDWNNRVGAVRAHIASCGFGSFPFLKRAIESQPDTMEGRGAQYDMLDWFLRRMSERELSEEQKKELHGYLLARAMSSTNASTLVQADKFLQRSQPAYANSRQRLYLSGKQNMRDPTGQMNGYFAPIKAELAKLPHVRPHFTGAVLPVVTVPVTVWIVRQTNGSNPARDAAEIPNHLAGANMILWQSGLTLIQNGPYHLLNNTNWLNHIDVTNPANTNLTAMLNTTNSMGNAVELYFVNMLEGGEAAGVRWPEGIAIASGEDAAHTLAHEVLHDCGLEDIYTIENPDSSDPNPIPGPVSEGRIPSDWGGGYYLPGLTQRSLVTRLIMRSGGFSPEPPLTYSVCLPRGPVYGWRYADGASAKTLGHAGVGQNAIRRAPGSH